MEKKFIMTDDKSVIEQLYKKNFQLMYISADGCHTFFNEAGKKLNFTEDVKVYYTDKLCL